MRWASIRDIPPGGLTKNFILVRLEGSHLELGDTKGLHRLLWPSGDLSGLQRWLLRLSVHGLSRG